MKCSDVQSFFDQMVHEGDTFDNDNVVRHMNECEVCRREYVQWRSIAQKLSNAPSLQAPPALYARVMEKVDKSRAEHNLISALIKQLKSQFVYIPVAITALVLFVAGTMILVQKQSGSARTFPVISKKETPVYHKNETTVIAHFKYADATAKKVTLVGDFNRWDKNSHQLQKNEDGTWTIDLTLPKGCYQYLFYVDESIWETDPHGKEQTPDGFGGYNTVIEL